MLKRYITNTLQKNLANFPAVVLLGPRQVGKTTLALEVSKNYNSLYLDLESPEDLVKLTDPLAFLKQHKDKLIVLDEIQCIPNFFPTLRGVIDQNKREGHTATQFLLLGSASLELLKQSSESLAGRISYVELGGINILEAVAIDKNYNQLWLRGGFPDSYLAKTENMSWNWRENFIRTYLERDVPQMGFRVPANRLRRLWTMLAHLHGEGVNFSKLAANLEVDAKTISNYIDILVDLLLVYKIEPWHENIKKRLTKSPRFYVRDSGILHKLLGIYDNNSLLSNPILGKSWEGFVLENIRSVLPLGTESYFYRTAAGAEIDLLLKFSTGKIWAIEIKYGLVPKITRGFYQSIVDIKASQKFVIYSGEDEYSIDNDITVIALDKFLAKIINWSAV